ncbi:hypothetical protein WJX77_012319 [Trebouxia sp. C0004]
MSTTNISAALTSTTFASKVIDKSATLVKYSSDIKASWTTGDQIKNTKGKGSLAGSLYYTASDNDSQSETGSAYDAVSQSDSEKDFQIEVASTAEGAQQQAQHAAPMILFGGSGLESTSAATANTTDEEFDYAFASGARQGATYQRVFKPEPAPVHLISALHQAHLSSLAEGSEEGSDLVSESDGGLIHDDDLPIESSPAASASLDQSSAQMAAGSSTNLGSAAQDHRAAPAAAASDGMFELDIDDDFEQEIEVSSFTEMGNQQRCPDLEAPDMQKIFATPAAAAQSQNANAALSKEPVSAALLIEEPQSSSNQAQQAQCEQPQHTQQPITESGQQSMPDSVPEAALLPLPILGPLPEAASLSAMATASQPRAALAGDMTQVDLEEIEVGKAARVGATQASAGQVAADEWEEVNLARAKETAVDAPSAAMPGDKVRYPEALNYFLSADVKAIKKTLNKSKPVHRMASCFMRMQKSSKRLEKERTRLLCLAKMPFDDSNLMHLRLLQSVYLSFVGGPGPVGRYGPHWATLGFQGSDPTTDLRGCGILGLLHLLLLHEHDPANAQAIFKLSTAKESEFPLAPVSLNITKWTLQMVRERKLTSAAKKQQSAVTAASDFYVGTFYTLYNHWKDKKCTMADSGFVLNEIEKRACSNVMNMVRRAVTTL